MACSAHRNANEADNVSDVNSSMDVQFSSLMFFCLPLPPRLLPSSMGGLTWVGGWVDMGVWVG